MEATLRKETELSFPSTQRVEKRIILRVICNTQDQEPEMPMLEDSTDKPEITITTNSSIATTSD